MGLNLSTWTVVLMIVVVPVLLASPSARGEGLLPADLQVAGVDVGLMKPEHAVRVLSPVSQSFGSREITVEILDETHVFTAADIGLVLDPVATIDGVVASGTGGSVPMVALLDPAQFQIHLDTLHGLLPDPAIDAKVVIENTKASVVPGDSGQTFDLEAYRSQLLELAESDQSVAELAVQVGEPNVSTEDAETTASQVNTFLSDPIVFANDGQTWELAPENYAQAIIIAPNGDGALTMQWDLDQLMPAMSGIIAEIEGIESADAWVQDLGTHSWIVPEQDAYTVNRERLLEITNKQLQAGEHIVQVPVTVSSPQKSTEDVMAELGITEIIASGDSVYTGSGTGRTHNVETAAYYIDRTLVPPGGSYSFNESVGSLFTGEYMSAGSYIDGPSGESIAGGVCQVSTTVFRAALNAGFPIEERWPHSYRSPFYELGGWNPGFDAAIVQDSIVPEDSTDMRFTNPTDSWIIIMTTTDGENLTVEIWGEDTGYTVDYSEPDMWVAYEAPTAVTVMVDDQLPPGTMNEQDALPGLGVWYTRTVTGSDGEIVLQDTWQTVYFATGPIVRVSPDMEEKALASID